MANSTELLPLLLSIAQAESPAAVLGQIIQAILRNEQVALARIWLVDTDTQCPVCQQPRPAEDRAEKSLHMRASGGRPSEPGADWNRLNGSFHRVPLSGNLKLAHMANAGEPVLIPDLLSDQEWVVDPAWAQREGLRGFVGHPLRFRGNTVGVLAIFLRVHPDQATLDWLQTFAAHAAVAIGNCRAYQQIDYLRKQLETERDYLQQEVIENGEFREILGRSAAIAEVLRQVDLVASTDSNVLIQGASGTGKELVARAIHQRSRRAARALVKVNCGSIPQELFESEFFGHVKGAFTGALRDRMGRFQLADGGTLFLDEVGEIPLDLQVKLLRVLQEGEFERVGDETTRRVNVRVLAATNRDLRAEVQAGRFRLDLYYRLSVFPLEVPSLSQRREDVPLLAGHFVRQACARLHLPLPKLPQRELDRLQHYAWPGNVRELQNVVERAVILARGGPLSFQLEESRPAEESPAVPSRFYTEREWRRMERDNLISALRNAGGRVSGKGGAAELLGVNQHTLASRLRALGIRREHVLDAPNLETVAS